MTFREALTHATAQLRELPELREDASEDATLLLLHVLGNSRAALLTSYQDRLAAPQQAQYNSLIARRMLHEPVHYIIGEREFYGLPLKVTPAVLIPRNLTEHLVEAVLAELSPTAPLQIADVGTGSGAIAIALAFHLPLAHITALDTSREALAIATHNAYANRVANRVLFLQSDLLATIAPESPLDAIVSNPPYVPELDGASLAPQVREFEPHHALFAASDGLALYHRLIPQAYAMLRPNGLIALEFGPGQHDPIAALLATWQNVRFIEDFDRTPRIVLARRPAES